MKPRVSVVIPAFNAQKFLRQSIESVLAQNYINVEILVVNDGSSDGSESIIKSYGEKVVYLSQQNRGAAAARNAGISAARGEYIAFLDSDDLWKPEKLSHQMNFFERNQHFSLIYHDYDAINERGVLLMENLPVTRGLPRPTGYIFKELIIHCLFQTSTVVCKRSVFEDVGYFDERFRRGQDYDLWLRISANHKIGYLPLSLSCYRQEVSNACPTNNQGKPWEIQIVEKALADFPEEARLVNRRALKKRLARPYFDRGYNHFWQSHFQEATCEFKKCLKARPLNPKVFMYCAYSLMLCYLPFFSPVKWKKER